MGSFCLMVKFYRGGSATNRAVAAPATMRLNWKLFSLSNLQEIELFKKCMEATTAG